jgi:DNA-binding MarR family transcriptional regulator
VEGDGEALTVDSSAQGNKKDRRCQLVILTEEGKEFAEPRLARHIQRIGKYFSPLTDLEKEILLKILTKLRRKIA